MKCESVRLNLSLYIEEELEPLVRKQIERHLRNCYSCQSELMTLANTVKIIRKVEAAQPPRDYSKIWRRSINGEAL